MKTPNETKFRDACIAITMCFKHFDDEIFEDEEKCKNDLRVLILGLLDKYRE